MLPGMDRARAWVLLKVKDPKAVAAEIEKPMKTYLGNDNMGLLSEPDTDYVIVRADVVGGESGWNLVVPVDAGSGASLDDAIQKLIRAAGDPRVPHTVLRVEAHHPAFPHRAHSFISAAEFSKSPKDVTHSGRHWPASPGANPWG
jgi:hypothetical protein